MSDYFLLDPDYADFPDRQKLKFLTVYGEQHNFLGVAIAEFLFFAFVNVAILYATPNEISYLLSSSRTQAIIISTCDSADKSYTYAYSVSDTTGETRQYTGIDYKDSGKSCPKVGDSITIDYLLGRPESSIHMSEGESHLLNVGIAIFFVIFTYRYFLRQNLLDMHAFVQARPKFVQLAETTNVIDGKIVKIRDSKKEAISHRLRANYIEVEYQFSADNRIFKNKQVKRRNDLRGKPLPPLGTPVRVLYADENTYVML